MVQLKGNNVIANCPGCDGAKTTFEFRDSDKGREYGYVIDDIEHTIIDETGMDHKAKRRIYRLLKCSTCGRAGMSQISEGKNGQNYLVDFYPHSTSILELPKETPEDIVSEFREAESDASHGNIRSAGAMLRSTLEKVLQKHGYIDFHLTDNIKDAFQEGLITRVLKNKTEQVVKSLGDTILHKEWRKISEAEYEEAHQYTRQIIEEFFSDPREVLKLIMEAGRLDANGHLITKEKTKEEKEKEVKTLRDIADVITKEWAVEVKANITPPKPEPSS